MVLGTKARLSRTHTHPPTLGLLLRLEGLPLTPQLLRLGQQELHDALLAVDVAGRGGHGLDGGVDAERAVPERLLRVTAQPDLLVGQKCGGIRQPNGLPTKPHLTETVSHYW